MTNQMTREHRDKIHIIKDMVLLALHGQALEETQRQQTSDPASNNNLRQIPQYSMSAARKVDDAARILGGMLESGSADRVQEFARTMQEAYDALLDEYSKKFRCKTGHTSLSRFKANAKKLGNVNAISFLIWYEKEFRAIRGDPAVGFLFEEKHDPVPYDDAMKSCSELLERTRNLVYQAYERF